MISGNYQYHVYAYIFNEMVKIQQNCHRDAKFQISWRLDIKNPVKMTSISELDPRVIDVSRDGQDPTEMS